MSTTQAQAAFMEQTATRFETTNGELQGMLRGLLGRLEALQGQWAGSGARSFHNVKEQWANDQSKLQQALLETAGAIRTSGRNYTASDSEATSRMNSINSGPSLPL
jgi:WXG100 family type VII secretion target